MEERLILLDNDDNNIGEGSKKDCESPLFLGDAERGRREAFRASGIIERGVFSRRNRRLTFNPARILTFLPS